MISNRFQLLVCKLALILVFSSSNSSAQAENYEKGSLTKSLQPFVASNSLAGAVVLVANKEKILTIETVGLQDIKTDKKMQEDCVFWIASQSKPITAAALMILVDEGKLSLNDPIEKYLPEFRGIRIAINQNDETILLKKTQRLITIKDILNHTSGMPFRSAMEVPTLDGLALRDAVRSYAMTPLQSEPGTKYAYSNSGINTAGRIIEVVSNMPYEEFLNTKLFKPLGMKDTTFWPNEEQISRLAKSYKPDATKNNLEETVISQLIYPLNNPKRQPMPAGGLFSTAKDVAYFCQMVLNMGTHKGMKILSEKSILAMTTRQTDSSLKESYGLGWSVNGENYGHGGAQSTNMNIDIKSNLITVYMVQHAGFPKDGGKSKDVFKKSAESLFKQNP